METVAWSLVPRVNEWQQSKNTREEGDLVPDLYYRASSVAIPPKNHLLKKANDLSIAEV